MSAPDADREPDQETYIQHGDVVMRRDGDAVVPSFDLDSTPATSDPVSVPSYPLGPVPTGDDVDYTFPGEPDEYPEMDFRRLANSLPDGKRIPDTTYLTHGIHDHPAIFIPHIPSYLIRQFTTERNADGDRPLVLDPFSGSGTTGLEAKVNGRDFLGVEINPLSRLVSEVATAPIPPTTLRRAQARFLAMLEATAARRHEEYDAEFLDGTDKDHWFEPAAIEGLSRVRKAVGEFRSASFDPTAELTPVEDAAIEDLADGPDALRRRLSRWLTLMIANTVYEVSNADPGVSKAYKSKKMRRKIEAGEHPPDVLDVHENQLETSRRQLTALWNEIYGTDFDAAPDRSGPIGAGASSPDSAFDLAGNDAHHATVDVRLGDARTFDFAEYREAVDVAITSPPYINAMNYYRGSKLRLFWIYDFLEDDELFDATALRKSIVGTNAVSMSEVDRDLPATMRSVWTGTDATFESTRLPHLDDDIETIHGLDHTEAERKAYVTWKFFAADVAQNLARVYEHLKPGGYYFFVIGENTIGERLIHSHKYVADIARHLGKIDGHGGEFGRDEGFRLVGSAWDEISNRDLFAGRNHGGGVIECEWVTMLQKPPDR